MLRTNPRATAAKECLDAVRLARDPDRLHQTPAEDLVTAAAMLARGLVSVIDGGGLRAQRASALDMIEYRRARDRERSCAGASEALRLHQVDVQRRRRDGVGEEDRVSQPPPA